MKPPPTPVGEGGGEGRRSFRPWRIVAATLGTLVVLAALLITALRIALAYLPEHAGALRAWVQQQTRMRIEYSELDARLRWFGPEVVLRGVRVLEEDGSQALFTAREGSVGLDLWNFFRTGQLVAGRVHVDRPRVTLVRLQDGRLRLLGLGERPSDRPPFDFDRLPAGRVVVENATVVYRDLRAPGRPPLELRHIDGVLRRDHDYVRMEGQARLPETLGSSVEFDVRLKGSLDDRAHLDARLELATEELRLAGLAEFVPARVARPLGGRGPVRATLALRQGHVADLRLTLGLRNVVLGVPDRRVPGVEAVRVTEPRVELEPGDFMPHPTVTLAMVERPAAALPQVVRFDAIAGDLRLRQEARAWSFRADELRVQWNAAARAGPTRVAGQWWGRPVSRFGLQLELERADLAQLWPLALALAPASFDPWAGLAPTGNVASLRVQATRDRAGLAPRFTLHADVRDLGVQPHARAPGVRGLTATVDGTERRGRLTLQSDGAAFEWPRLFREPIEVDRAQAVVSWRRDDDAWVLATRKARLAHGQTRAGLDAELRLPAGDASPVLSLDAEVEGIDVATVPRYIPVGRLRERTIAWLDRAFVHGSGSNGRLHYRGPVRQFPFRNGEGEFLASADVAGLTLDYYPGFAPLVGGAGHAVFRNAAIEAQVAAGEVGGLRLDGATFTLSDYRAPVLGIGARGSADLHRALAFVQSSPLGPRIGGQFMGLRGNGPAQYEVRLVLPIVSEATRRETGVSVPALDYFVRARLAGANVALPALRAPAQRVTGVFELHNERISVPSMRGTILDGPFELVATPGPRTREATAALDLQAHGRASGARLPGYIGLPATIRMAGTADWTLRGRIERHGEGDWPLTFGIASDLTGLQIDAPRPFAKPPAEARSTDVRIDIPGGARHTDVTLASASARAKLRFAEQGGHWRLDRGTARFDGQPVAFGPQPGLLVAGDWPQFDLAEWLALGDTTPATAAAAAPGQRLMDWLGPVDVHLDRATVFGFELTDVVARLRGDGDAWRVSVSGPRAVGQITVPDDLSRGRPIVLAMQRLHLQSADEPGGDGQADATATDPRRLPAITVHADDFVWQSRRFGRLDAAITRDPRGLTFDAIGTAAPAFSIDARGSWYVEADGQRTRLEAILTSTDFGEAASALGYRNAIDAQKASMTASLWWPGGPSGDVLKAMNGTLRVSLADGQLSDIEPGAGRMLGLLSVAQLPRRLALDFRDVTDKGLAFNSVKGDFELRAGNAYTQDLLVKGPAVDIGVVGRTGLGTEDYDQTVVVSGNTGGPLAVAGALAAGPVVGAGVLVLSQLFKDQLQGLARVYYHVSGPWSAPVVQRIAAPAEEATPPVAAAPQAQAGTRP